MIKTIYINKPELTNIEHIGAIALFNETYGKAFELLEVPTTFEFYPSAGRLYADNFIEIQDNWKVSNIMVTDKHNILVNCVRESIIETFILTPDGFLLLNQNEIKITNIGEL
jgi:hypothetical protein